MVRFLVSILLGAAVTFALFAFMAFLIDSGDATKEEALENIIVEVNTTPPKSEAEQRRRVPPPPPPPPKTPPKPQAPEPEPTQVEGAVSFNMPGLNIGGANTGISGPGAFGKDGDIQPIVRIEPKYPLVAQRDGIEGWVKLSFTINKIGGVEDVKVIDSEPKRIFDKEARRAVAKWKYKPQVVDGKPLRKTGQEVQLDFSMGG